MRRSGYRIFQLGVFGLLGGLLGVGTAQAQYGGYPGYGPSQGGWSVQVGGGYPAAPVGPGYAGYPSGRFNIDYGAGVYPGVYPGNSVVGYPTYPSPAQRQGYREGRLYWETGIAPNRPLSPAEARGFVAGERRAASTPWQLDPARQQGYREGRYYWETGIAPNRPLSPAEAQGFQAGENRAAGGSAYPY